MDEASYREKPTSSGKTSFKSFEMELPDRNTDYRNKSYWDERYAKEEAFDWFAEYDAFKHLLQEDINPTESILVLGCGNSTMSEQMYQDDYHNITNTDYSPVVIDNMKHKCHRTCPEMKWEVMDILNMTYEPSSFDVVLEKGTLDALMVHEKDPWNISEETEKTIETVLHQVQSLLKPNGKFISITFSQPHFRRPHYARQLFGWSVNQKHFGDNFHYFYFVCQKGQILSLLDSEKEKDRVEKKIKEKMDENKKTVYLDSYENGDFLNDIEF